MFSAPLNLCVSKLIVISVKLGGPIPCAHDWA